MSEKLCVVFVCQAGELELKGLLLAASLRMNAKLVDIDLVAAVPDPEMWGTLTPATERLIKALDIRKVVIECPFGSEYPIGNKLAAIGVETSAEVTVFLDSDILCLALIRPNDLHTKGLKAKPADLNTYQGSLEQWELAYQFIGEGLPSERVLSTVSRETMLPYFNAGVVAVNNGKVFADKWLQVAKQIDECEDIQHKRPWLDQVALPVAAKALGYHFDVLDESFNYPAHLKPLDPCHLPKLCHYHSPDVVAHEPSLSILVGKLCEQFSDLRELLDTHTGWSEILKRAAWEATSQPEKPRFIERLLSPVKAARSSEVLSTPQDFLITGFPRSGTSLLCNILNKTSEVIVINEPQEVFAALKDDAQALGIGLLYRKLRTHIATGKGVQNKVDENGDVIEDTRFNDVRRHYLPDVHSPTFKLATKNPLAYLTRLRLLCDAYPLMPKIVMIRHPLDLISSWKASFEHLNQVDLSVIPFASEDDPLLDGTQRNMLSVLRSETYLPVKRALYFNYLAEMISRDKEQVHVVRYEDLTSNPEQVLLKIGNNIGLTALDASTWSSVRPSTSEKAFDEADKQAIESLCGDFMREWGYV